MSNPHDPNPDTPRDAAPTSEITRDESLPGPLPASRRGSPHADPRSVRVTDDGITEIGFDDPELRPLPPDQLHYHVPHPDPHPESHEHSDVPIRPLAVTLAAIAGTCLFTFVLLYFVFWHYKGQQQAQERPRTAVPNARPSVPGPRLQGVPGFSDNHPSEDLVEMRAQYKAELEGVAPNPDQPTARIPITRAMDIALERKLFPVAGRAPATRSSTAPATGPSSRPASRPAPARQGANR